MFPATIQSILQILTSSDGFINILNKETESTNRLVSLMVKDIANGMVGLGFDYPVDQHRTQSRQRLAIASILFRGCVVLALSRRNGHDKYNKGNQIFSKYHKTENTITLCPTVSLFQKKKKKNQTLPKMQILSMTSKKLIEKRYTPTYALIKSCNAINQRLSNMGREPDVGRQDERLRCV